MLYSSAECKQGLILPSAVSRIRLQLPQKCACFNDEEIAALAELTKQYPLDVRFIEMMPMYNSGDFDETAFLPCEKVLEVLPELAAVEPDGGVAQLYQLPGAMGRVGLIRPVNAHFCGSLIFNRVTPASLKGTANAGSKMPFVVIQTSRIPFTAAILLSTIFKVVKRILFPVGHCSSR